MSKRNYYRNEEKSAPYVNSEISENVESEEIKEAEIPEHIQEHPEPEPKKAVVKCAYYVTFRKKPSLEAAGFGVIKNGTPVEVLGRENDFYKVNIGGQIGYVDAHFITLL